MTVKVVIYEAFVLVQGNNLALIKSAFNLYPGPNGSISGTVVPNDLILCGGIASTLGSCLLFFGSSVYANANNAKMPAGVFVFQGAGSLDRNIFLVVDIRQYNRIIVETEDQFTTVVLTDLAQGFNLRISDDPMIHATICGQFGAAKTA